MTKVAINGFGRIGRSVFKTLINNENIQIVAINDLTDIKTLAYLLKHDTMYGEYIEEVSYTKTGIVVNGVEYKVLSERNPSDLPWKKLGVSIVVECTGLFRATKDAGAHIDAGAKKVVLSAPGKGDDIPTYVFGVNEKKLKKQDDIISNGSCTTNCIAPIVGLLNEKIGVKKVMMSTIHSYTAGQSLIDGPKKDPRRGRSAAQNIVPTTTGAIESTIKMSPEFSGKFDGISIRVPTAVVSLSDFVFILNKKTSVKEVNKIFVNAKKAVKYMGIIDTTNDPLVSSDFIGDPSSSVIDLSLTQVVDGDMLKVVAWYDNEWAYSQRLAEMVELVANKNNL